MAEQVGSGFQESIPGVGDGFAASSVKIEATVDTQLIDLRVGLQLSLDQLVQDVRSQLDTYYQGFQENITGIVRGIGSMIIHNMCRGDEDLNILREYIDNNPVKWQLDGNYLENGIAKDGFRTRPYVAFD